MYDENKIKRFKYVVGIIVAIVVLGVGFTVGNITAHVNSDSKSEQKVTTVKKDELSRNDVAKFDLAFFTKKDLGENRNRYKGLMTEAMYNQEVSEENEPVNQAYKGMVINQALKSDTIYVNTKDKTAITEVEYTNTQLQEPNNLKTALENQSNKATLKLTFVKQGKKYLVNEIKWLTANESDGDTNSTASSMSMTSSSSMASSSSTSATSSSSASSSDSEDEKLGATVSW